MPEPYDLPSVEAITVGTVGPPGQRVFYLQARLGPEVVTLKCEKTQVAALATALTELLADLPPPGPMPSDLDLQEPVQPAFVAGAMALTPYDVATGKVTLVVQEAVRDDTDDAGDVGAQEARFGIDQAQIAALAVRGADLVQQGRPNCPLCGQPIDPSGHACPRSNGHLKH